MAVKLNKVISQHFESTVSGFTKRVNDKKGNFSESLWSFDFPKKMTNIISYGGLKSFSLKQKKG